MANLRLVHARSAAATFSQRAALLRKPPLARYRWNPSHSVWIRWPMPPREVLENQPELPPVLRPVA